MEQELNISDLITDYQSSASQVVKIFKEKYKVKDLLEGWHAGMYKQTGNLSEYGLKFYAFHGIGIAAHFKEKLVDFDFAYIPELRYDGFDLWRLTSFVNSQPEKYGKYKNKQILKSEFDSLIKDKLITNPKTEFHTTLYFWAKDLNDLQLKSHEFINQKKWWEI